MRDPRIKPHEGDVLYQADGTRKIYVDKVDSEIVMYRVIDGHDGLFGAYRTRLFNWRESAPHECDESEMFCPSCDGRGYEYQIVSGGLLGKEVHVECRMCAGSGRLHLKLETIGASDEEKV